MKKKDDAISEILKMELTMDKFYTENRNNRPNNGDRWVKYRKRLKFLRNKFGIS
jgi:hypothetical protein